MNKTKLFNLLKLIGAVIIFYLGLKLLVPTTEDVDFTKENLYDGQEYSVSDELDDDFIQELGMHNVAPSELDGVVNQYKDLEGEKNEYLMKYQNMCMTNIVFCTKVIFNGENDIKDQYMYLASAIYVLNFIEKNIKIGLPIKNQLKAITVNPAYNARRGSANWTNVTINLGSVKSYVEFMELISHELGHVVDLGVIKGVSTKMDPVYTEFGKSVFASDDSSLAFYKISWQSEKIRKATAIVPDFCSRYGMSDPFEDFAECHNLYLNHNALFKKRAQSNDSMRQKYNFFANLYGGAYMFASSADLQKYTDNATRPWDTTKM